MTEQPTGRGGSRPGAGRPRLSPDRKRVKREIFMAPDVWAAVDAQARKFELSVSATVEEMVQASLERVTGRKPTDA